MSQMDRSDLDVLVETGTITTEDKNLRSKIESLNRSLKSLESKKERLDYEIKKQRKSLIRKREELKRVSKRNLKKTALALESGILTSDSETDGTEALRRYDARLLRESSLLLDS